MRVKFNKAILNYILALEKYDTNVWIQSVVFSIQFDSVYFICILLK